MTQSSIARSEQDVFAPGVRVLIRDEEWLVRATQSASATGSAVHVTGLSELVRNRRAIFRTELDRVIELRPEETKLAVDPSPEFRRSRLYLDSLLRRTPPTDACLHIGHRAAMNPARYQLVPAAKALAQARPRLLLADGVGLGKTIEVGVLLAELIQRGQGDRILVVALKSILTQFQQELWGRFAIALVRLDSVGIERVRAKIPSSMNPFHYFGRVIISIDTLKRDEKYRGFLEDCDWDAVVIDECQNVAVKSAGTGASSGGTKSQRSRLASVLARRTNALILTSATPHDGTSESFASLMNLLEPTAVANPSNYTREDVRGLFVRRFKKDVSGDV
jgi:SNF2 family DNA or RNA helicase